MKAIVAELGTTCLEIEAGSPHALAVGGCHLPSIPLLLEETQPQRS